LLQNIYIILILINVDNSKYLECGKLYIERENILTNIIKKVKRNEKYFCGSVKNIRHIIK